MSDGFVQIFHRGWDAARAEQRVASVDRGGLRLGHPLTGRIAALDEGREVEMDRASLLASLARAEADATTGAWFTFKYWLHDASSPHSAVVSSVGAEGSGLVGEVFWVDGLNQEEKDRVYRIVFEEFQRAGADVVAYIADNWGGSLEVDWADLLLGGATAVTVLPNVLVLPADIVAKHPELEDLEFRELGSFLVHDPDGVLREQ